MAARMRLMSRGERAALACVVCALAAGYSAYALLKHWHFDSSYDLAIYDQAIWHLSRFERPASSIRSLPNVFGDHFHPIIALFASFRFRMSTSVAAAGACG